MIDQETLKQMKSQLRRFVSKQIDALFEIASDFIKKEQKNDLNILMFGRALDRFYKRIQFLNNYEDLADLSRKSLDLIQESTKNQCDYYRNKLISKYNEELANVLHDLINDSSRTINRSTSNQSQNFSKFSKPMSAYQDGGKKQLLEAVINFETSICENLKQIFADLNPFLYQELTFSNKEFRKFFQNCLYDIIIKYVESILESFEEYEHHHSTTHLPSCFMLILSKVCLDLSESIISYMFGFAEETLSKSVSKNSNKLAAPFNSRARLNAQKLLDAYVWLEGQSISQMIRKSVETRDWLSTVEPRSVRSVMKRVIEDITSIDYMIGQLYEEGTRIERSSDSSRNWSAFGFNRSNFPKSNWSIGSSSFDNSIISNIQKIFNDKIEIFGSVEFSKLSVATGIIKISLKTLIECVRLCTFSRYGFQQIQVDSYYLQTKLWRFISDEKIILNLIDEVISSSKKRCLDPIGMERSVIENIYDNV
ncbi:hypothetical protein SSS_05087 [Sarcoptes scabiei]|nr:hypothetical protein SSS_05087 [Sarcoptes scabiei]